MELAEIATQLRDAQEKIILIYAFNATGKTRLSVEYKEATRAPPVAGAEKGNQTGVYYNAFSEDLFVWNNDIENGEQDVRLMVTKSSLSKYHSLLEEVALSQKLAVYKPGYKFRFNGQILPPDNFTIGQNSAQDGGQVGQGCLMQVDKIGALRHGCPPHRSGFG